jgi:hypothetical protein
MDIEYLNGISINCKNTEIEQWHIDKLCNSRLDRLLLHKPILASFSISPRLKTLVMTSVVTNLNTVQQLFDMIIESNVIILAIIISNIESTDIYPLILDLLSKHKKLKILEINGRHQYTTEQLQTIASVLKDNNNVRQMKLGINRNVNNEQIYQAISATLETNTTLLNFEFNFSSRTKDRPYTQLRTIVDNYFKRNKTKQVRLRSLFMSAYRKCMKMDLDPLVAEYIKELYHNHRRSY